MTPLIARVLLTTDFSRYAARAFDDALAVASWWKAELHVLEFLPGMNPDYPVNQMYLAELRKDATRDLVALETSAAQAVGRTGRPDSRARSRKNRWGSRDDGPTAGAASPVC